MQMAVLERARREADGQNPGSELPVGRATPAHHGRRCAGKEAIDRTINFRHTLRVRPAAGGAKDEEGVRLRSGHYGIVAALGCLMCLMGGVTMIEETAGAQAPLIAEPSPETKDFSWMRVVTTEVPVMKHSRGSIPPMILFDGVGSDPLTDEQIHALLARGFTQHLPMSEKSIPAAKALQAAGAPVVLLDGGGGSFPSDQAGDPSLWAHQFDAGYKPKEPRRPCPGIATGWAIQADRIRDIMRKFRDAGVTVNAVWMDWEGDPYTQGSGTDCWDQARHCSRCRATLPAKLLASHKLFDAWRRRRFYDLAGAYLAAPVLEIFPACSVLNWQAVASTPQRGLMDWEQPIEPIMPPLFTAVNPSAYGDTKWYRLCKPEYKRDREHVDQFWMHILLQQISDETANRLLWTPEKPSIPWVERWLPESDQYKLPVMTRERYRELLRHLWLRGISGMQVFNPHWKGYERMSVYEVLDAAMVYDEMMAYSDLIESGVPLNLKYPAAQDDGAFWSGLRLGDRAVIRVFKQGGGRAQITVTPWPGVNISMTADAHGETYVVTRGRPGSNEIHIEAHSEDAALK
jgi:hypothetical protein